MQFILFEDPSHFDLLPLCYTRPVFDLRVGIDRLSEKWNRFLPSSPTQMAAGFLAARFSNFDPSKESIFLNGKFIPNESFVKGLLEACQPGHFVQNELGEILAFSCHPSILVDFDGIVTEEKLINYNLKPLPKLELDRPAVRFPWDIFKLNGATIREDVDHLMSTRSSVQPNDRHSIIYGGDNLFMEPGVKMRAAIINAEDGPVYLGHGVQIQENAVIHGTHAICESSTISMGAKLRGDSTVGPHSKIGGEVGNSVIQGFSNKGHDGYLGNSVLGQWCNLGADTNTSNLKNNYTEVKIWNYKTERFAKTGSLFCGLIMGDHSKCGINTMFNTGTVVGVSANVFGGGYQRNFIPSFTWGGTNNMSTFALKKSFGVAEAVMKRRNIEFDEAEKSIMTEVFEQSKKYRTWDLNAPKT